MPLQHQRSSESQNQLLDSTQISRKLNVLQQYINVSIQPKYNLKEISTVQEKKSSEE